jgi:hypothetical protein
LSAFVVDAKGDDPLYQTLLRDSSFFELLLRFDDDLAATVRQAGCAVCGGALHSARYQRKPRGGPPGLGSEYALRQSFCCATEGCRRRATPPSLRFLGRKVFFGLWVLLLPVLREGPTPERLSRLEEVFVVSRRTLLRWRRWWREVVPRSRFWQSRRGDWASPVPPVALPGSLLAGFGHLAGAAERALSALRWLAPLGATGSFLDHAP